MARKFIDERDYSATEEMRGAALPHLIPPTMVERGNEGVYAVVDPKKCTGCGISKPCCFYFVIEVRQGKTRALRSVMDVGFATRSAQRML